MALVLILWGKYPLQLGLSGLTNGPVMECPLVAAVCMARYIHRRGSINRIRLHAQRNTGTIALGAGFKKLGMKFHKAACK